VVTVHVGEPRDRGVAEEAMAIIDGADASP
jgi:hypothetical protein